MPIALHHLLQCWNFPSASNPKVATRNSARAQEFTESCQKRYVAPNMFEPNHWFTLPPPAMLANPKTPQDEPHKPFEVQVFVRFAIFVWWIWALPTLNSQRNSATVQPLDKFSSQKNRTHECAKLTHAPKLEVRLSSRKGRISCLVRHAGLMLLQHVATLQRESH